MRAYLFQVCSNMRANTGVFLGITNTLDWSVAERRVWHEPE